MQLPPVQMAIKFSERPEWADVTPLEQYENVNPLAPILYTAEYKDATDYFRGIVHTGEKSQRVLELTEAIIRMNPAHYSAWQYRYETLLSISAPVDQEITLMDELAVKHLKTYQVWHHRRLLLSLPSPARTPSQELQFISNSLTVDTKNYHTWSYRQWLLAHFNDDELWERELDFVDSMVNEDVRNNSAWHHRFFVVFESGGGVRRKGKGELERVLKRELIYVKQNISLAPNNASAWNYLRGILDHTKQLYASLRHFVEPYAAKTSATTDLVDLDNPPPSSGAELPCVSALEFLADIYESEGGKNIQKAVELWKSLGDEYDTIRKKYWEYRIRNAIRSL